MKISVVENGLCVTWNESNSGKWSFKSFAEIHLHGKPSIGVTVMRYDGLPLRSVRLGWVWFSWGEYAEYRS